MRTIQQIQNEIIDEFDFFEDWSEKYQYLIDLGKNLPNFDNKSRIDSNLIKGCQSKVWLNSSFKNNTVIFEADSDAIISKGIISLLIRVFSGHRPEDILEAKIDFIEKSVCFTITDLSFSPKSMSSSSIGLALATNPGLNV